MSKGKNRVKKTPIERLVSFEKEGLIAMIIAIVAYLIGLPSVLKGSSHIIMCYFLGFLPLLIGLIDSFLLLRMLNSCNPSQNGIEECKKNANRLLKYDAIVLIASVIILIPLIANFTCLVITYLVGRNLYIILQESHQAYAIYYTVAYLLTMFILMGGYVWHTHLLKKHIQELK